MNKEIRDYQESIFFGLSLRQFIFSAIACAVAVGMYFGFKDILGQETVSWVCVIAAFPFAVLGFVRYRFLLKIYKCLSYVFNSGTFLSLYYERLL